MTDRRFKLTRRAFAQGSAAAILGSTAVAGKLAALDAAGVRVSGDLTVDPSAASTPFNRMIFGQFLEHSRFFYFRSGKQNELDGRFLIGSADWMSRNLLGRVEVIVPVEDKAAREKIWESVQIMLNDKRLAWDLESDGTYKLRRPTDVAEEMGSQDLLAEKTRLKSLVNKLEELKI